MRACTTATCRACWYDHGTCTHPDQADMVIIIYNGRPTAECYNWTRICDVEAEAEAVLERALERSGR